MLKKSKLILAALAILVIAIIVLAIVSLVWTALKVLFVLAVVLFAASMVRKLTKKSKSYEIEEKDSERELNAALRQLEEIKRKQLVK
jgi:membrane protein implicated in regulation of membrane protease activity